MSKARDIADLGSNDVLDTSSSGIDVTGSVTSDSLTVEGNSAQNVILKDDDSFSGADNQIKLAITPSVSDGNSAGIAFGTYSNNDYWKQGIFWQRNGSYGVGDLIFANRESVDTTTVSDADQRMRIARNGDITMYKDDGTTSGFEYDASTANVTVNGDIKLTETGDTTQSLTFQQVGGASFIKPKSGSNDGELYISGGQTATNRMKITTGGDIIFYKDDGSTTGFFYDCSSQNVHLYDGNVYINYGGLYLREDSHIVGDERSNFWVDGEGGYPGGNYFKIGTYGSGLANIERIRVYGNNNTNTSDVLRITSGDDVVINENGYAETDFRVETNANANAIFVDNSADKIGLFSSSPGARVQISGLSISGTDGDVKEHFRVRGARHHLTFEEERTATETDWNSTDYNLQMRVDTTKHQAIKFVSDASYGRHIDFHTQTNAFRMRIADNGRVGIGTNSPSAKLHTYDNTTQEAFRAETGGAGSGCKIILKTPDNGSLDKYIMQNAYWTEVGVHKNEGFRMRNSDGNVKFYVTGNAGNCVISGSLSKGSGSFKIDHPLPEKTETHNLVHSFVEAPQADNIYRGKVDLVGGSAIVNIDTVAGMTEGTFAALNREIQCFTSNETGWTAVRGSVSGNTLTIEAQDNTCTDTISWLVVGERQDAHMYDTDWTDENGKVILEPLKVTEEDLLESSRAYHESNSDAE